MPSHSPDLLAESKAAGMHGARAEAAVYAAMLPLPLPDQRQADVRVFGDWSPRTDPAPMDGPRWYCTWHAGVSWCGNGGCWVCEGEESHG